MEGDGGGRSDWRTKVNPRERRSSAGFLLGGAGYFTTSNGLNLSAYTA
jgi:hypothetical protein